MTPLANHWLRQIASGAVVYPSMLALLADVQCFDATEVWEMANVIGKLPTEVLDQTFFAPAMSTWIEINQARPQGGMGRIAICAKLVGDEIEVFIINEDTAEPIGVFDQRNAKEGCYRALPAEGVSDETLAGVWWVLAAYLAIINTPRLVVREVSAPHKGTQKRLKQAGHAIELRSWATLRLEMTPRLATGDASHEARISGRKCLHFCRSHLRVQRGRLVVVRPHWRGDAALGVKCKDYEIAA